MEARKMLKQGRHRLIAIVSVMLVGVTILFGAKHTLRDRAACSGRSAERPRKWKIFSPVTIR